jgi:hypothetical protein
MSIVMRLLWRFGFASNGFLIRRADSSQFQLFMTGTCRPKADIGVRQDLAVDSTGGCSSLAEPVRKYFVV